MKWWDYLICIGATLAMGFLFAGIFFWFAK
jgi:hypothetical protein